MKKILLLLFFLIALSSCHKQSDLPPLKDTEGKIISLQGHWTILNYWAQWCEHCQHEIPMLNTFYQDHKNKKDVYLLGVNYDHVPHDQLKALAKKMHIQFPVLVNDPSRFFDVKIEGIPIFLIIDPQGHLKKVLAGEQTLQTLEAFIRS